MHQGSEHLENLDLALPAGSVITGQVVDEDGAALPLVTVRVLRDVYRQGQQQVSIPRQSRGL